VHLSRGKAEVGMFAPDENQMHVINHLTGSPAEGQSRYISLCISVSCHKSLSLSFVTG